LAGFTVAAVADAFHCTARNRLRPVLWTIVGGTDPSCPGGYNTDCGTVYTIDARPTIAAASGKGRLHL